MFANRVKKYGGTGGGGGNPGGEDLAIELDGIDQHLITESPVAHATAADWGISLWFYTVPQAEQADSTSRKFLWCDVVNPNSGTEEWGIGIDVSPTFSSYFLRRFNSWLEFTLSRGDLIFKDWNHLVITKISAGGSVAIYQNNVYLGAITDGILKLTGYSCFGGDVGGLSGSCMTGYVNDIRLFSRNLSAADVTELYNSRNQDIAVPPELDQCFLDEGPVDSVATGAGSIIDTSVASNNLTPVNGPIYRMPPFLGVLELDGVSQYLATSSPSGNGTGAFAVSLWLNYLDPQAESSRYKVLWQSRADMGSGQSDVAVAIDQNDRSLNVWYNNSWLRFPNSANRLVTGQFSNIVLTKSVANSFIVYVGSVNCGNTPLPDYNVDGYSVFAGQPFYGDGRGDCLTCELDDIRIFDYAFSQAEVNALYGARNEDTPSYPSDLGKWFLDEGPDGAAATDPASIIDTSIAGNNLTPYNGPIYRPA